MTTKSPPSPYIFNQLEDKGFVLRTHPFYSIFYHTNPRTYTDTGIRKQLSPLTNNSKCKGIINNSQYDIINTIPFNLVDTTDLANHGKKNVYFFSVVMLTTIVVGIVAFSYWPYVLENISDEDFKKTMERRSLYMTILFIILSIILSVMCYELFTLRSSLKWFQNYKDNQNIGFYNFTMRKLSLWVFMILWLVIVMTSTTILSKRSRRFKETIALNIISGMTLFIAQYLYYQSTSQFVKNFGIFLSVFTIGLMLFLFYGL